MNYGDTNTDDDIALLYLQNTVMEAADSRRPMNGLAGTQSLACSGDTEAGFGIAGWSPASGTWDCPSGDDAAGDLELRELAPVRGEHGQSSFGRGFIHSDNTITWWDGNSNKARETIRGTASHHLLPDGKREVVGVQSSKSCDLAEDFSYYRNNYL